jgi:hypothetical protein
MQRRIVQLAEDQLRVTVHWWRLPVADKPPGNLDHGQNARPRLQGRPGTVRRIVRSSYSLM